MSPQFLTIFDLTGIQSYIFSANVMKENIGGSWLARGALSKILEEVLDRTEQTVIFSGGGNALVVSPSSGSAERLATRLSRRLLEDAPGLEVACVHQEWDGQDSTFGGALDAAHVKLAKYKAARWPAPAFDGCGVVEVCATTGEPAVRLEGQRAIGVAADSRLQAAQHAEEALWREYPRGHNLTYTTELNELGKTSGERSSIGVIHFDGNSIGDRLKQSGRTRKQLARLSDAIQASGTETLRRVLDWVELVLPAARAPEAGGLTLVRLSDGRECFPVRPLVFGGDDITLVCDGRLAVDIAARLLTEWQASTAVRLREFGGQAHACVGITLTRVQYPFHRAYRLAEAKCRAAKTFLRDERLEGSALNWMLLGGDASDHEPTREGDMELSARPYIVPSTSSSTYRSWKWFRQDLVGAWQEDDDFRTQRKALGAALRQGKDEVRHLLKRWQQKFDQSLPAAPGQPHLDGFYGSQTPYLDALELVDRCLPWSVLKRFEKEAAHA